MTNEIRPSAVFVPPWLKPVGKQGSEESAKQFRKQLAEAFKEDEEGNPAPDAKAHAEPEQQDETPKDEAQAKKEQAAAEGDEKKVGGLLNKEM